MEFLFTSKTFPFSGAVIHSGRTLETVITGIPRGESKPVEGGVAAEMREIFRQLVEAAPGIAAQHGVTVVTGPVHLDPAHKVLVILEAANQDAGRITGIRR